MGRISKKQRILIGAALALGVVCLLTSWFIAWRSAAVVSELQRLIDEQEATLVMLSETTDRDGADAVVGSVVRDCAQEERERFDSLLGELGTLQRSELEEIDALFTSCGYFYTQRKAIMVAQLEREYEVYASYIALLSPLDARSAALDFDVETWRALVDLEKSRSAMYSDLVSMQLEIITSLRGGAAATSVEIANQINAANEIRTKLVYTGTQIDRLREQVTDL